MSPRIVEDLTLTESVGIDDVDAIVLKAMLGPSCYYGQAETLGWKTSLYLLLHSDEFEEPKWQSWGLGSIGAVDRATGDGSYNIFPCNSIDAAGNPDVIPPGDLQIVEKDDNKGYIYFSPTLCATLLEDVEEGEKAGVDMDKLLASPYVGIMPCIWSPNGTLRGGTAFSVLKKSFIDSNFPPATMTPIFTWLIGVKAHWSQLPAPKSWPNKKDGSSRTVLGVTQFYGHDPNEAAAILAQGAQTGRQGIVVPAPVVAVGPVAAVGPAPLGPMGAIATTASPAIVPAIVAAAPVVAAPVALAAPVSPAPVVASVVSPAIAGADIPTILTKFIMENLAASPQGIPFGQVSIHAMSLTGPDKSTALQLIREQWVQKNGPATGQWQVSADGRIILPAG